MILRSDTVQNQDEDDIPLAQTRSVTKPAQIAREPIPELGDDVSDDDLPMARRRQKISTYANTATPEQRVGPDEASCKVAITNRTASDLSRPQSLSAQLGASAEPQRILKASDAQSARATTTGPARVFKSGTGKSESSMVELY